MPPRRKTQIVRGRTKNKARKSLEERKLENEGEGLLRHEVAPKDLLENCAVDDSNDESLSLSSESSSSIASTTPWQKKKSLTPVFEVSASPIPSGTIVAIVPSRILRNETKKNGKKGRQLQSRRKSSRSTIRSSSKDSNDDSSMIEINVKVGVSPQDSSSQHSSSSSEDNLSPIIRKKKNRTIDKRNERINRKNFKREYEDESEKITKKKRKDLDGREKNGISFDNNLNVNDSNKIPRKGKEEKESSVRKENDEYESIPKKNVKEVIPKRERSKESSTSGRTDIKSTNSSTNKSAKNPSARGSNSSGGENLKSGHQSRGENGRNYPGKLDSRRDRDSKNFPPKYSNHEYEVYNHGLNGALTASNNLKCEKIFEEMDKVMNIIFDKDKDHDSEDDSELRFDFFDRDKDGKIVHQDWIPMFPEDFSSRKQQWPLSWWGIVEPPRQLMYPEPEGQYRQVGGYPGNPYQNPQHVSNISHSNNSLQYPPQEGNMQYNQRDYIQSNMLNNPPSVGRIRGQEGWGNPNPNDSRNFDGRGGWQDRPPFRGPPNQQWGKEHGPNPQLYQDEKRW